MSDEGGEHVRVDRLTVSSFARERFVDEPVVDPLDLGRDHPGEGRFPDHVPVVPCRHTVNWHSPDDKASRRSVRASAPSTRSRPAPAHPLSSVRLDDPIDAEDADREAGIDALDDRGYGARRPGRARGSETNPEQVREHVPRAADGVGESGRLAMDSLSAERNTLVQLWEHST